MNWIQSFLTVKKQQVALEGTLSSPAAVLSGIPQGTVLCPLLFLTYINDLPDAVQHCSARPFADDSLLYRRIKDQQDKALLQEDLDSLKEWEHTWQIEFNPSKCSVILIMPNEQRKVLTSSYLLHRQTLETTSASKYLGITISSDLSWSTHVQDVTARGNRTVGSREGTSGSVLQKLSQRPAPQWYAPHWSIPRLSGIPTSKRTPDCWKKFNVEQPGM